MFCIQHILEPCFQSVETEELPILKPKTQWDEVKNYKQCLETMKLFLEKKIEDTPIYKLEEETNLILEELLILNKLGFLSIDSQPLVYLYSWMMN